MVDKENATGIGGPAGVKDEKIEPESVDTETGAIRTQYNTEYTAPAPSHARAFDYIDWASGWTRIDGVISASPTTFVQPELVFWHDPGSDYHRTPYCFYEYSYQSSDFRIGVASSNDWVTTSATPDWNSVTEPLLSETGSSGDPDEVSVADPTVIPPGFFDDGKGRMWIDMEPDSNDWTLGLARIDSGDDPTVASNWTKVDTDSNGVTDILLDSGNRGRWDDKYVHNPEAYLWDGVPHVLYGAKSDSGNHTDFSQGLAIADDPEGRGDSLEKWGPVTDDATSSEEAGIRIKSPVRIGKTLYATMNLDTANAVVGASSDGGRTWVQVSNQLPSAAGRVYSWKTDERGRLWGIQSYSDPANVSMLYKEVA
jgi:hypothetical protein